jgi:hypothetical protein
MKSYINTACLILIVLQLWRIIDQQKTQKEPEIKTYVAKVLSFETATAPGQGGMGYYVIEGLDDEKLYVPLYLTGGDETNLTHMVVKVYPSGRHEYRPPE